MQPAAATTGSGPPAHSSAFRLRRFLNWFPLGLAYAFLYMGRYNLTVAKNALGEVMTKEDFGVIFGAGTLVYGIAFVINGPLTDKIGGKKAMLIALLGAAVANLLMGLQAASMTATGGDTSNLRLIFSVLYVVNMYFQSFGAVAIVKVNAHWFHVRERGGFSGIFGTMISSGIFLAFTVNGWVLDFVAKGGGSRAQAAKWVFYGPAALLGAILVIEFLLLRDRPSQAGHQDFDCGDGDSGADSGPVRLMAVMKRIVTNPIVLTIAFIEFCTGVLRQGVMNWYPIYAKEWLVLPDAHWLRYGSWAHWYYIVGCFAVGISFLVLARKAATRKGMLYVSGGLIFLAPFMSAGWGGLLMVAGVIGGNVAGWVSDSFFGSRRAPAAGGLYLGLAVAAGAMYFSLGTTTTTVAWSRFDKKAAEAKLDQLSAGDRVLAVEGVAIGKHWSEVQKAIACIPAACKDGAKYDSARCMCTNSPRQLFTGTPHEGPIVVRVARGGQEIDLRLRDPGSRMRAGDTRYIKAGPVSTMSPLWLGIIVFVMSLCVIGTHGLLSGTATMDFGGRKGAATAVGLIDGFVYLGTALQAVALGYLTPRSWGYWPLFMLPFAVIGFLLTLRIWNAKPGARSGH